MELNGKVIIVTGASYGIGEATARLLSKRGARVVLAARSATKLEALARELPGSAAIETDMTKPADIKAMIDGAQQHFGRVDALVNNAGRGIYGQIEHIDAQAYEEVFRLNVVGPLLAMEYLAPRMRNLGGGTIVNISSMVSKNYYPRLGVYASTKYALNCISLTARAELAPDNIIVSVVYPGLTDTDFGINALKMDPSTQGMESRNRPNMPGADSPEHVAGRIAYALESGDAEVFMH